MERISRGLEATLFCCKPPAERLPRGWNRRVQWSILHVISLAHYVLSQAHARAMRSKYRRARSVVEHDRLVERIAKLEEELRIKDARMRRVPHQRRPHYIPTDRMAILELRAVNGWTVEQTADAFLVTPCTISTRMRRLDRDGGKGLLQTSEPVNKFPSMVRYLVQRLKVLCPRMGRRKIAETLARAGLELSASTVGRMLREPPTRRPAACQVEVESTGNIVRARRPDHIWNVDLTVVPTSAGMWASWFAAALPQRWPFCWWVAIVLDHHSRTVIDMRVFDHRPSSAAIRSFLGRLVAECKPKYLICDKG